MRRRTSLVALSFVLVACGVACVDLFHGTDFDTLCSVSPADPRCGGDAAKAPDVATDTSRPAPRPHPDFCSWDSTRARSEAARACAWLGACEGPLEESAFGPCMVRAQLAFDCTANKTLRPGGAADAFWSCLSTVKTCADVDACAFPQAEVDECKVFDSGMFISCGTANPSTRLRCNAPGGGRPESVLPCPMLGKTCSITSLSSAECTGTVGALSPGAVPCTTTECQGTIARACTSTTQDDGFDCASQSAKCVTAGGVPACATTSTKAPTCAIEAPPACTDAKIVACVDGHELSVDCSLIGPEGAPGLGCDATQLTGKKTYDITEACTLTPATCTGGDSCAGTKLTSCGRGATYEVDCVTVGLRDCTLTQGGAACVP